jgi:hypothetical protein
MFKIWRSTCQHIGERGNFVSELAGVANARRMSTTSVDIRFQNHVESVPAFYDPFSKTDVDGCRRHPPGVGEVGQNRGVSHGPATILGVVPQKFYLRYTRDYSGERGSFSDFVERSSLEGATLLAAAAALLRLLF